MDFLIRETAGTQSYEITSKSTLQMKNTTGDLSLYKKHIAGRLVGISGVYVDDIIVTGSQEFRNFTARTNQAFDSKYACVGNVSFMGVQFQTDKKSKKIEMEKYISTIAFLEVPSDFKSFNSTRHKLAWVLHTRPDIACAVAKLRQITESQYDEVFHAKGKQRDSVLKSTRSNSPFPSLIWVPFMFERMQTPHMQ